MEPLLSHILTAKFIELTPFYRQEKELIRLGVKVSRTSMCKWAMQAALTCQPLLNPLQDEVLSSSFINIDETTLQVPHEPYQVLLYNLGGQDNSSIVDKPGITDVKEATFSHVPCQIVTLAKEGDDVTCSRGYGQDVIHSILHAGEEFGLKPAREDRFTAWINIFFFACLLVTSNGT
ncbi:MAG: transposase [Deltaproteobacteria bacterium]|nr:transposase [Deltaproteobacteria bacterium]